jgi:hypothetical protein
MFALFIVTIFNCNFMKGGEAGLIWQGPSWYGTMFANILKKDLGSDSEVDKIKVHFPHIFFISSSFQR